MLNKLFPEPEREHRESVQISRANALNPSVRDSTSRNYIMAECETKNLRPVVTLHTAQDDAVVESPFPVRPGERM